MINVSFTKFLDFVAQTGEPKATSAEQAWRQSNTPYDPAKDYHKRMREALIEQERAGQEIDWEIFISAQNPKKQANFQDTVAKYSEWRDKFGSAIWFDPPRSTWAAGEFSVNINPELGLQTQKAKHVIKLYINKTGLSKLKAQVAGLIMLDQFGASQGINYSVLDVKASKLFVMGKPTDKLRLLLLGEIAHLNAMLKSLAGKQ